MARPRYKPGPRPCEAQIEDRSYYPPRIRRCRRNGTILDARRSMERTAYPAAYICLTCARREYPDVFPPLAKQGVLLHFARTRRDRRVA